MGYSCSFDFTNADTRYSDDENEYRHVLLPKEMIAKIPKDYFDQSKGTLKLLWEEEWRGLGITQVRDQIGTPSFRTTIKCASYRAWDGSIMRSMNQNHTYFSLSRSP